MPAFTPTPTGVEHVVGINDLFFSSTNARGVIEQANQVFVRLSVYSHAQLIGSPHNIIRHPQMPGGLFRIIWDMLGEGRPTCAYVKNLAADGSAYWAFATITPVGSGYLSVRSRPCSPDLLGNIEEFYRLTVQAETEARFSGASQAQAAELGADVFLGFLREIGFASYGSFLRAALPVELAARAELADPVPMRPQASGALAEMLVAVQSIDVQIRSLSEELDAFQDRADALNSRVAAAYAVVDSVALVLSSSRRIARRLASTAPVLASSTPAMQEQTEHVEQALTKLHAHIDEVRTRRAALRFTVSLCELQSRRWPATSSG